MTALQIKWAASHDWFVMATAGGAIWVRDESVAIDGSLSLNVFEFNGSFSDLRAWAGY